MEEINLGVQNIVSTLSIHPRIFFLEGNKSFQQKEEPTFLPPILNLNGKKII